MIDPFDLPADITFYFECGCRYVVAKAENSLDGLSCCSTHEAPYQNIRNLLPLKLVQVTYHPKERIQMGEKLIIHNRDGSKTEVEPLKAWQPSEPREMDRKQIDEWLSNAFGFDVNRSPDNPWAGPKPFSSDIACAWELMTIMSNRGKRPRITRVAENEWACSMDLNEPTAYSPSAPLAICQAVILALTL